MDREIRSSLLMLDLKDDKLFRGKQEKAMCSIVDKFLEGKFCSAVQLQVLHPMTMKSCGNDNKSLISSGNV